MPLIPRLKSSKVRKRNPNRDLDKKTLMKYYNNKKWKALRDEHIRLHPLCQICEMEGQIRPAQEVHHVRPFVTGNNAEERDVLAFCPEELLALCKYHHHECHHGALQGTRTISEIIGRLKALKRWNPVADSLYRE